MIIKGIRLRSSSSITRTILHLQNGDENDAVAFLHGTPDDIRDMHRDAVSIGSRYAVRHWIIAPHEGTAREQMAEVVKTLAKEFFFDPSRSVVVEHRKRRATADATDTHWHLLVGEVDPATGRILATSFDRIKHELIARMSEFSFGHTFVPGKHTAAVVTGLRKRGLHCIADRLEQVSISSSSVPREAFTHGQHQESKRQGLDLPTLKLAIRRAVDNARSREEVLKEMSAIGLDVKAGDKPETWIVVDSDTGVLLGALHRLCGLRKSAINELMEIVPPEPRKAQGEFDVATPPKGLPREQAQLARPTPATAVCDIGERIAEMEQSALHELEQAIPVFLPTPKMQEAKEAVRLADADLSHLVMQRTDLDIQIANLPPIRWWSRFTGSAGRRKRNIANLETALAEIQKEIRRKEMAFTVCRQREVSEEKAAKDAHFAEVADFAQRQKKAREALTVLIQAKMILEENPEVTAKGLDFVLSAAITRMRNADTITDQMDELSFNRSRSGRGLPRR